MPPVVPQIYRRIAEIRQNIAMETLNDPEALPILGWVSTAVLLLVAIICRAAGTGRIQLNGVVGLRIPPLTQSPAAWQVGHGAGVLPASVAFAVALISSVAGLFAPIGYWGAVAALVGGLIWVVFAAMRAANTA